MTSERDLRLFFLYPYTFYLSRASSMPSKLTMAPPSLIKPFNQSSKEWQLKHITGISYNSQGQGIVEYAHRTLKAQILKHRKRGISPTDLLSLTIFTKYVEFKRRITHNYRKTFRRCTGSK